MSAWLSPVPDLEELLRIRTVLVTLVLAAMAFPATSEARCGHHCRLHKACSNQNPHACVENAVLHGTRWMAPWQRSWMRRVPGCESGWDPYARNPSGSSGLFQFLPSTWAGLPRTYSSRSIWSAKAQSLAAAYMLKSGRSSEWVCR